MKTSELTGAALDWAVAKCEGFKLDLNPSDKILSGWWQCGPNAWQPLRQYSANWGHGGEIIEREKIRLDTSWREEDGHWAARIDGVGGWWGGDTPLVAAMRCYVASKLGDEVDVPEELLK